MTLREVSLRALDLADNPNSENPEGPTRMMTCCFAGHSQGTINTRLIRLRTNYLKNHLSEKTPQLMLLAYKIISYHCLNNNIRLRIGLDSKIQYLIPIIKKGALILILHFQKRRRLTSIFLLSNYQS